MNNKFLVKRLNQIKLKLKFTSSSFEESTGFGNDRVKKLKFTNILNLREGIRELGELNLFPEVLSFFQKSFIFQASSDEFNVDFNVGKKFIDEYDFLIRIFLILFDTISNLVPDEKEHSVIIKLARITDFDDLTKVSKKVHDILSQTIIHPDVNGKIEITSVDNGSIWIEVCLGSLAAVKVLSSLFKSGALVYQEIQKGRIMVKEIEGLAIKNESLLDIKEGQKKLIDQLVEAESKQLTKKFYKKEEQEQIVRIKNSIISISELIQKGSELHPSINAPEGITKLFPDFKELESVSSKMALLNIRNAQEDKSKE